MRAGHGQGRRGWGVVAAACAIAIAGPCGGQPVTPPPSSDPPRIERLRVTNITGGRATVRIEAAADARTPADTSRVALSGPLSALDRVEAPGERIVFEGQLPFDAEEWRARQARTERLTGGTMRVPVFAGRELIRWQEVRRNNFDTLNTFELDPVEAVDQRYFETSLMIRHPSVVKDPRASGMGPWSFGHLMTELAKDAGVAADEAPAFVEAWLKTWLNDQPINGFTAPARPGVQAVIDAWPKQGDRLDLARAPFRLLAIVNRVDLRKRENQADTIDAGEARFVFGLMLPATPGGEPAPAKMTVIFEYGVTVPRAPEDPDKHLRAWGQRWADLTDGDETMPSEGYNAALQKITDVFTSAEPPAGEVVTARLAQLRTNDFVFETPWELREFKLASHPGRLQPAAVGKTPQTALDAAQRAHLVAFVSSAVPADPHGMGEFDFCATLRGASSIVEPVPFAWTFSNGSVEASRRFNFSLNSCNGCHSGETMTTDDFNRHFTHVRPDREDGSDGAELSEFLIGLPSANPPVDGVANPREPFEFADPVDPQIKHKYWDLGRRAVDLVKLTTSPLLEQFHQPLRMEH